MAQTVASFVYPKLSSVDVNAHSDQPITVQVITFADVPIEEVMDRVIDVVPGSAVTQRNLAFAIFEKRAVGPPS